MIHAAHNGKKVTVVVELQARSMKKPTFTGRNA
jgi:polyphosphate kinase